jgi:hypothetical protein
VAFELDVILDVDARRGPLMKLAALGGIEFPKEAGVAAWSLAEGALVQSFLALTGWRC